MPTNISDTQHIVLARHLETEKNLLDIHGTCSMDNPTELGVRQAERLASRISSLNELNIDGVVSTKTKQAIKTAQILADYLQINYDGELGLLPYNIGVASGISSEDLRIEHPESFISLKKFRARLIDAKSLRVKCSEGVKEIEKRLISWWEKENKKCLNKVIIGSSSTVLMLSHMFDGILPTSDQYKFLGTPNGTMRYWRIDANLKTWSPQSSLSHKSWPEISLGYIPSHSGDLAASFFHPGWDVKQTALILVPGYFGSSRHGPYGLYTRLARQWAYNGFLCVTYDPLGSGESSFIHRDFETEVESAVTIAQQILSTHKQVIFVGHSMGAATALKASNEFQTCSKTWCFAPLCKLDELAEYFLDKNQLRELTESGSTLRHGLKLELEMIGKASSAWETHENKISVVFIAGDDPYTRNQPNINIPPSRQFIIEKADHNFSHNENLSAILNITTNLLFEEI